MIRFVGLLLAVLAVAVMAAPVDATGCYAGTTYQRGYSTYSYTPSYYYAAPYYPVYQASYAPDPDAALKDLKHALEKQNLTQQVELGKAKLEFEQYKLEQLKRQVGVPAQGEFVPAPQPPQPAPRAAPPRTTPAPAVQPAPMPNASEIPPKTSQLTTPHGPHPAQSCVMCHDQKVAAQKGGNNVGFIDGKLASAEFAFKGIEQVVQRKMPVGRKLNDQEISQVVLAFTTTLQQAPQSAQK